MQNTPENIYEKWDEDFRHLCCAPNLQIVRVLAWAHANLTQLRHKIVRTRINELIFEYGKLDLALNNQFETCIYNLQKLFSAIVQYCHEDAAQDHPLLLWAAILACDIREYITLAITLNSELQSVRVTVPSFLTLLLDRIKTVSNNHLRGDIANALVRYFQDYREFTSKDAGLALTFRIAAMIGQSGDESTVAWNKIKDKVIGVLQACDVTPTLNAALAEYMQFTAVKKWRLTEEKLIGDDGIFSIDLQSGEMSNSNQPMRECTEQAFSNNKDLFAHLGLSRSNIRLSQAQNSSLVKSFDGAWRFESESNAKKFTLSGTTHLKLIANVPMRFKFLEKETIFSVLGLDTMLFESYESLTTNYRYWISETNKEVLFVEQLNHMTAYLVLRKTYEIYELIPDKEGGWQKSGRIHFYTGQPTGREWINYFTLAFGSSNIRWNAKIEGNNQYRLESIDHLGLGLTLTVDDNQQLICDQLPGYHLSEQKGLAELPGALNVLIFENQAGEFRYLIPAFKLHVGENNNAFSPEKVVDYYDFCNPSQPYYIYTLNRQHELIGQTLEATLYLAILQRSLGDFKSAFRNLARCQSHNNITQSAVNIAVQVYNRKIQTPTSAAFDLKLECFLREHQNKWSKSSEKLSFPEKWGVWVQTQLAFYQNTLSHYKNDVAILPSYSRLNNDDFSLLGAQAASENLAPIGFIRGITNDRLVLCAKLPVTIFGITPWSNFIEGLKLSYNQWVPQRDPFMPKTWRYFAKNDHAPAYHFVLVNFNALLDKMLPRDNDFDPTKAKRMLYAFLQNDTDPPAEMFTLISILHFVCHFRILFESMKFSNDPFVNLKSIGHIARINPNLQNVSLNLLKDYVDFASLTPQESLPSDFAANPLIFSLADSPFASECAHPLGKIADNFFSATEEPLAQNDFALTLTNMPNATPLERRLLEHYQKGHQENQSKSKSVYKLKESRNIEDLRSDLNKLKKSDTHQFEQLEIKLLQIANQIPNTPLGQNFWMARASEQKLVISISDIFTAFLQRNPQLLTAQNPFLSQKDIDQLFIELSSYALLKSRIDQINQVFEIFTGKISFAALDRFQLHAVASNLDKQRAYNPIEYPELLVYEYATARLLRQDQVITLIKLFRVIEAQSEDPTEMHHCLLQFAAGGGKTSVLVPILAHRFAQKGFLPVILNTNELYQIGLEDIPSNLRSCFNQNMEVVERDLDHTWTKSELNKLLQDLKKWQREKKCLLLKPVTWHSINLAARLAYVNRTDAWKAANEVLDFFKDNAVKIEDECHLVSDPLQISIKTFGSMQKIPDDHLHLLLRYYDCLMGIIDNAEDIPSLAGIKTKKMHSITPQDLQQLQKKLAIILVKEPAFKNVSQERLLQYLTQAEKTRPQWLLDLRNTRVSNPNDDDDDLPILTRPDRQAVNLANLIVLARAFLQTHLPYILTLQYKKDYGASIHPGDLTVAPKHEGKDVTSHFGDHTLVASLTMQIYLQRGLLATQMEQLLAKLSNAHSSERNWNHHIELPTQAELWLLNTIPSDYRFRNIRDLTPDLRQKLTQDKRFCSHPLVVKRFLLEFALPQIKVPQQKQSSSAADLQAGFKRSVSLSATPGLPEIYPAFLKPENCFLEAAFEAQVIDTLLQLQNSGLCTLNKVQNPEEFFSQFSPELLSTMTSLIDRGALLTEFDGQQVVESYLGLDKEKIKTQTGAYFYKEHLHLTSKDKNIKGMQIRGTGLVEALKKQSIQPEQFLLFLFLDLSRTTGTDIKRTPQDHAGLTVGKGQTVTETIQAAMRERQLLDKDAQSVTWLMFASLYHEINPNASDDSFDARLLFYWMIKNEAKLLETKLIERAYQGIDQALKSLLWDKIKDVTDDSFVYRLRQLQDIAPWDIYEVDSKKVGSEQVLRKYVESVTTFLGGSKPLAIPTHIAERIELIIQQTTALITTLQDPPKKAVNAEVQQELQSELTEQLEQQQQQTMKKKIDTVSTFVFAHESYLMMHHNVNRAFDPNRDSVNHYQILRLPKTNNIKVPPLYADQYQFSVFYTAESWLVRDFNYMKPIKILLIQINPDKTLQYVALTAAGGEYYSFQLNNESLSAKDPAYALVSVDGDVLYTTNNLTVATCAQTIARDDCQRMLSYAALLNGTISNPIMLSQLIKEQGWSQVEFETIAQSINENQVSTSSGPLLNNQVLYQLCGWINNELQAIANNHARYQPPQSGEQNIASQLMRPLKEHIDASLDLIPTPKRALADFMFTDTPIPMGRMSEESELALQVAALDDLQNLHDVPGKDFALQALKHSCQVILNSFRTVHDKSAMLKTMVAEFASFDQLLDDLQQKLLKFSALKDLESIRTIAQTAIKNAYIQYAKGISIAECKVQFKATLHDLLQTTDERTTKQISFFGKKVVLPKVMNHQLSEALMQAEKSLEVKDATSTSTSSPANK